MSDTLFSNRRIVLAPMAGVGDAVFRQLCREQGAELIYTEMVAAKVLSFNSKKTAELMEFAPNEDVASVQLFGHEPDTMAAQASIIARDLGARLFAIDINMGCPARKIAGKGDGAALMRDPELAERIVAKVVSAVSCPVTVKFRRGFEQGHETCVDFARRMERAGASAVAIHGRYAQQFYRGEACWEAIARVKEAVSISVVGNGDVCSGADALNLISQTGCDAVMVGRAAEGNPWVFRDIASQMKGGPAVPPPSVAERMTLATRHARLLAEREGRSIVRMRKHAMWYLAGTADASESRRAVNTAVMFEDFAQIFEEARRRTEEAR